MSPPASVSDWRARALSRLPRVVFDYIDGGAYGEVTLRRNVEAFEEIALRQRVMVDVSAIGLGTSLFGQALSMPVVLGPVGMAGLFARRGEVQAASAAQAAGVAFTLSTVGVCPIEEVAAAAVSPPWFQLYMIRDRGWMADLLARARASACPALVFTVDLPVPGARYRDVRSGLTSEPRGWARVARAWDGLSHPRWMWDVYLRGRPHSFGNVPAAEGLGAYWRWIGANFDPAVTWADLDWVRQRWDGPIVLKGVLDPEDARTAVAAGVDGIVVSNHGGRQLDGVPAAIDALPVVAAEVAGAVPLLMDGGVRSGLDVLKALALGASGVMLGRAWAYALAGGGEAGVAAMLETLRRELQVALALTGCTDVRHAGVHMLVR